MAGLHRHLRLETLESRRLLHVEFGHDEPSMVHDHVPLPLGPKSTWGLAYDQIGLASVGVDTTLNATVDYENFDSVTAPDLPTGWIPFTTSTNAWVTETDSPDTTPNRARVSNIEGVGESHLTSPPIALTSDNARVSFRNSFNTETDYDGGVLEISIDGAAYVDILEAGGEFISGAYNTTLRPGNNPVAGRAAWSGASAQGTGGFITTTVDLPATAHGKNVQLRWRFGNDEFVAGTHWAIDTIQLSESPPPATEDFGDAPTAYPTLLAENGARHTVGSLFLGPTVDTEMDGFHTGTATGDGADEDGVTFPATMDPGDQVSLQVVASEAGGVLNAWFDWNQDGDWTDSGEHVFLDQALNAGTNSIPLSIPASARTGPTIARFRLSSATGLSFDGPATDGEVEDYAVNIGQRRLVWTNRGTASDRFDSTFGANAWLARGVVDAVFDSWERVITDLNHGSFGGPGIIEISVSMSPSGTGFGASAGASFSSGFPTNGFVTISRGNDTNGDGLGDGAGFFIDPTPLDYSEFSGSPTGGPFMGFAPTGSPARGKSDFFSLVNAEITHALGLFPGSAKVNNPLNGSVVDTNITDNSEGGGVGTYWVFDGPSVTHLMTSNNGGGNGQDRNAIIHSAGKNSGSSNQPVTHASAFRGSVDLVGADGPGNAVYNFGQRSLVNDVMALVFQDAYNYGITLPQTFGTIYSILDESTGQLTLRGGTGSSNDVVDISVDGTDLVVSIDVGNDIAGTGPAGDDSDTPAFVSRYPLLAVTSVVVEPGSGNDSMTVQPLPGIPVTIDGEAPNFPNNGVGDSLVILAGALTDPTPLDNGDGSGTLTSSSHATVSWSNIEQLLIKGPPTVEGVVVNDAEAQRSAVKDVVITFDSVVAIDESSDPFLFTNTTTGATVADVAQVDDSSGKTVVSFSFTEGTSVLPGGSLANGSYQLTVVSSLITLGGATLDGDDNGTAGDDYVFGDEATDNFFRQYGDRNGNGTVDLLDFADFRSTFGLSEGAAGYFAELDANNDDSIGLIDFAEFRANFG